LIDIHTYARYEPQVLQIEHHPYLTQEPLVNFATKNYGIAITAYSSLGPQSYVELGGDMGVESLQKHPTITGIAKAYSRSTSALSSSVSF
jgi:D-xylose reductase